MGFTVELCLVGQVFVCVCVCVTVSVYSRVCNTVDGDINVTHDSRLKQESPGNKNEKYRRLEENM